VLVGFALAGGGTKYGLSEGLGGGRSDMFQSAVYSLARFDAAYISGAFAYAWHRVSTDRVLSLVNFDHLTADFSAYDIGGRVESGYRFGWPSVFFDLPGFGITPYAAVQAQAFHTPSYNERTASSSSVFALTYGERTTTTTRTEIGSWFDQNVPVYGDALLSLRARAAWAHDFWSDSSINALFQSLPGSNFTVIGAAPAHDSLLASANAEISFANGISLAARFDTELAHQSRTYVGSGRLRYLW
jgi:outer membrane autotransporter protein